MSDDEILSSEELLGDANWLPTLPPSVRARVLAAALEARERRRQGRRMLASIGVLFLVAGGAAWIGPLSRLARNDMARTSAGPAVPLFEAYETAVVVAPEEAASIDPAADASAPEGRSGRSSYSRRERLMSAMGDDWRMVEAEFESREEFNRRVHM